MLRLFVSAAFALLVSPSYAVYRCVEDGQVSYSERPCASGVQYRVSITGNSAALLSSGERAYERSLSQAEVAGASPSGTAQPARAELFTGKGEPVRRGDTKLDVRRLGGSDPVTSPVHRN